MKTLLDHILILIGCCFIMDFHTDIKLALICMLIAMAVSEFQIIYNQKKIIITLSSLYLIFCFFNPTGFLFLPLIIFDSIWSDQYWLAVVSGFFLILQFPHIGLFDSCYLLFVIALVVLLAFYAKIRLKQREELIQLKDSAKELQLVMESRNQEILTNQDNEIHLATLKERNRIAREIHDNVGHMLSRSILMVGAATAINKDEDMKESLSALKDTLSSAMDEIRNSVHDLHEDSIDLYMNIRQIIDSFTFCSINLDYDMGIEVERKVKICFLAVIREACSNIMKHSNATNVQILVREHPAIYQLLIQDNGTTSKQSSINGMGLTNMQDRVKALDGRISITTEQGYRIFISVPKIER